MEAIIVTVAFVIFVSLVFKPAKNAILSIIDGYVAQAVGKLEEAKKIHKDAKALYAEIQKQNAQAKLDAMEIVKKAKSEAKSIIEDGKKELERITNKKTELTLSRISQQEKQIIEDLKSEAINLALEKVELSLVNELDNDAQMSLIDNGVQRVKKLIH